MSVTRAQKVRLGVFVATGLTAIIGGLVALAGAKLGEVRDEYTVRYDQAQVSLSGLEVGSPVRYSGIKVGRVDDIGIDPRDVSVIVVEISLDEGTPVAENTQANLGSMGITGLKYIELTRGAKGARVRKPGEEIPAGSSALDDLSNQAGEIAEKVSRTLDNVTALTGPDMRERVAKVLDRTDSLLATLEATVAENRDSLRSLTGRVDSAVGKIETLTDELTVTVKGTGVLVRDARPVLVRALDSGAVLMGDLRETRARLDTALAGIEGLMADGREILGPQGAQKMMVRLNTLLKRTSLMILQSRESVVEAVTYLRETAENLTEFSRKVREDPSLLLLGESEEEVE